MSYTPTTWTTGDTVTASAMNKIENGIAGAGSALIVEWSPADGVLDKTLGEIYDAFESGTPVFLRFIYGSPETHYEGNQRMCPVIQLYNYNYSTELRLIATCAGRANVSNDYTFTPAVAIFGASSTSDYPEFIKSIQPSSCTQV